MWIANHNLPLLLIAGLLAGCTTSTITNLTPSQYPRNPNGLYRFEAAWHSSQQSIRKDSIQPHLIVGLDSYPMQPTPKVTNRWETLAPIPADKEAISYRYKFDYQYNSIPIPRSNSKLSPPYRLRILESK